ncbi:MAG: hypothetical protein N3G19_02620 [Candidatus Pacearchaeota archaeon]|nr:hypothetical protein [Candidatus Pacearchaeota archaeon]
MTKEAGEKREKQNYRKIAIVFAVLVVVLTLVVLGFVFKAQLLNLWNKIQGNVFQYHGLTFVRGKQGNLILYATKLAIYRPVQNETFIYTLYLRNDPRVLEKTIESNISSKLTRKAYVSFEAEPLQCNGSILAAYKIGEFLDASAIYKKGAFANEEIAKNLSKNYENYEVKNCSDAQGKWSVILFKQSPTKESYIHQEGQCYILEVADCKMIEISERFILALIDVMKKQTIEAENNKTNETKNNSD